MYRLFVMMAVLTLLSGCAEREPRAGENHLTVDVLLKTTPVKDQGRSALCWVYAMLATIETEHLMRGDSVNLSVSYAARMALTDRARTYYLTRAARPLSQRGMASELLHTIHTHGLLAYDTYSVPRADVFNVLGRRMQNVCRLAMAQREGLSWLDARLDDLADRSLGFLPRTQFMLGAAYTPQEFARSVCRRDEYQALTSFSHHPFYERFALEVPDNYRQDTFLNLPIDSLTNLVERSLRSGHPVCWEGDVSEPGFLFHRGRAVIENRDAAVTQQWRQEEFETFRTTDDHCMAIVGLAHDDSGQKFFVCKNSWGPNNPYQGLMFLSFAYFKLKTIAVWAIHH